MCGLWAETLRTRDISCDVTMFMHSHYLKDTNVFFPQQLVKFFCKLMYTQTYLTQTHPCELGINEVDFDQKRSQLPIRYGMKMLAHYSVSSVAIVCLAILLQYQLKINSRAIEAKSLQLEKKIVIPILLKQKSSLSQPLTQPHLPKQFVQTHKIVAQR